MNILLVGVKDVLGIAIAEKIFKQSKALTIFDNDNNISKLIQVIGRPQNVHYVSFSSLNADVFKENFELFSETLKPLDGLVFNSGIGGVRPLNLIETHHLQEMMEENFYAFIELTKLLSKKKVLSVGSSIVAISSISSIKGLKSKLAYSASKAALDSAIRCLAAELGSKKIRVNSIQKGALTSDYSMDFVKNIKEISTDEILKKQFLGLVDPNDIADLTYYLLSDSAKSITGTSIIIDSGYSLSNKIVVFNFQHKRILITGGSTGIGLATARLLSDLGASIIIVGLDNEDLNDAIPKLNGSNHSVYAYNLNDVSNIEVFLRNIIDKHGAVDGFVHSAGIAAVMPLHRTNYDFIIKVMNVNFFSFIEISRCLSKKYWHNPGFNIVGISAVGAILGGSAKTAYNSSKAAMNAATRSMAKELSVKGIRVNTVAPGVTRTSMFNAFLEKGIDSDDYNSVVQRQYLGICEPQDIANSIVFLLSDLSRMITGTCLGVDGGKLTS